MTYLAICHRTNGPDIDPCETLEQAKAAFDGWMEDIESGLLDDCTALRIVREITEEEKANGIHQYDIDPIQIAYFD